MPRKFGELTTILNAAASTGVGTTVDVSDYDFIVLEVATASSADLTAKIQGSISNARPTFGNAASASNAWDHVGFYNLQTGLFTAGDTGIVYAGTDAVELIKVNTDFLKWLNINVTARSAGSITAKIIGVRSA
jgi:hypothetical protein